MYSNKAKPNNQTVVTRLTLWYALISAFFCISLFTVVSTKMTHNSRKRVDKHLKADLREFTEIYSEEGVAGIQKEFEMESQTEGVNKLFCRLITPQGVPLATSDISGWDQLPEKLGALPDPENNEPLFFTLYPSHSPLNTRMATSRTSDGNIFQYGINLHYENNLQAKIHRILIVGSLILLIMSTVSGWLIARRAMSGVRRITKAVSGIREDSLGQQVDFGNEGREINELVDAFNSMLRRIELLIREIKEVSDNVAHDLRSPITRIRGGAETTLTGPQEIEAYREMAQTTLEESDRLTEIINTTLEIAQTESGLLQIKQAPLDLRELLINAIELFQPVAEDKQIHLLSDLPADPIIIFADKTRIQRIFANLLDNAIKYTPVAGQIKLSAVSRNDQICIEISDTGPGIKSSDINKIFDRFYRGEKSRSSQGNGLGLCLTRILIQAHRGTITVKNNENTGCTFTITLPHGSKTV